MNKCLFCSKEIAVVGGKKKRQFCDGNCRNKYYYKKSREGVERKKPGRPPKPKNKIVDATKPSNEVKPIEQPQTNYVINTSSIENIQEAIKAREAEMSVLGNGEVGNRMKKILQEKIRLLNKELWELKSTNQ